MAEKHATARDYLTVDELADEFRLSRAWIYREVREGRLPHLRFGKRVIVNRQEFEDYARRAAEHHRRAPPSSSRRGSAGFASLAEPRTR